MATTFYFAEDPHCEPSEILAWFRGLPEPAVEVANTSGATLLHFAQFGDLKKAADGSVSAGDSPLVTLFAPKIRRRALWTLGEVHFLTVNMRQKYPLLAGIAKSFKAWLSQHHLVHDHKPGVAHDFDYYLEGSTRNWDGSIYAVPSGLSALNRGQYFISSKDNDDVLDRICQKLRLRGVEC